MKLAVLSESAADEAAIRILVAGVLGRETQDISLEPLRTRGWPAVINILPVVIPRLYYHTDADALVVIVDSDDSPLHQINHEEVGQENTECRLCQLRSVVRQLKSKLNPTPSRDIIQTALGLAVPSVEAWYRCGLDPHINEATWARKLQGEKINYTRRSLKYDVYGTERPSLELETRYATEAAQRLINDIHTLERLFPSGFGPFMRDLNSWRVE
jgi:hypothetical protein